MSSRVMITLLVLAVFAAVASSASAAQNRPALGPQAYDGPTLHPSGKDRYVEPGGRGTQGRATSDPDGVYNYGVDQFPLEGVPAPGGGLYTIDQDGNNGCGNDHDFEDDNNGRCGGRLESCPVSTTTTKFGAFAVTTISTRGHSRRHVIVCETSTSPSTGTTDFGSTTTSIDTSVSSFGSF